MIFHVWVVKTSQMSNAQSFLINLASHCTAREQPRRCGSSHIFTYQVIQFLTFSYHRATFEGFIMVIPKRAQTRITARYRYRIYLHLNPFFSAVFDSLLFFTTISMNPSSIWFWRKKTDPFTKTNKKRAKNIVWNPRKRYTPEVLVDCWKLGDGTEFWRFL